MQVEEEPWNGALDLALGLSSAARMKPTGPIPLWMFLTPLPSCSPSKLARHIKQTSQQKVRLGLKVYSMKFSSIDSGIKGGLSLSLKAGAKNLPKPWPCPTKVKCSLKKKFSLLKLPSGELIDFTDTDDILDMLVYTQEVEVAATWEDVTSWFSKKPDPIPDGIPDPQAGSELIMGALRHIATSNISLPSKLELNSSDTPPNRPNRPYRKQSLRLEWMHLGAFASDPTGFVVEASLPPSL